VLAFGLLQVPQGGRQDLAGDGARRVVVLAHAGSGRRGRFLLSGGFLRPRRRAELFLARERPRFLRRDVDDVVLGISAARSVAPSVLSIL
jgi:hypothetical protein